MARQQKRPQRRHGKQKSISISMTTRATTIECICASVPLVSIHFEIRTSDDVKEKRRGRRKRDDEGRIEDGRETKECEQRTYGGICSNAAVYATSHVSCKIVVGHSCDQDACTAKGVDEPVGDLGRRGVSTRSKEM